MHIFLLQSSCWIRISWGDGHYPTRKQHVRWPTHPILCHRYPRPSAKISGLSCSSNLPYAYEYVWRSLVQFDWCMPSTITQTFGHLAYLYSHKQMVWPKQCAPWKDIEHPDRNMRVHISKTVTLANGLNWSFMWWSVAGFGQTFDYGWLSGAGLGNNIYINIYELYNVPKGLLCLYIAEWFSRLFESWRQHLDFLSTIAVIFETNTDCSFKYALFNVFYV